MRRCGTTRTGPEDIFEGFPEGLAVYHRVQQAVSSIGEASVTASKGQVAFRRRKGFAYLWRPGQYVDSDVPPVLSISLPYEAKSERFKEVVHPSTKWWMHAPCARSGAFRLDSTDRGCDAACVIRSGSDTRLYGSGHWRSCTRGGAPR